MLFLANKAFAITMIFLATAIRTQFVWLAFFFEPAGKGFQSGIVIRSDERRLIQQFPVSDRDHGLAQPQGSVLVPVQQHGGRNLR